MNQTSTLVRELCSRKELRYAGVGRELRDGQGPGFCGDSLRFGLPLVKKKLLRERSLRAETIMSGDELKHVSRLVWFLSTVVLDINCCPCLRACT